jgi:hypothetical protein
MVESKTQMAGGYVALLLIRKMLSRARAQAQQREKENYGFQSAGMRSDNKLLSLPTFRISELTSFL